jgi:hypothetical protein
MERTSNAIEFGASSIRWAGAPAAGPLAIGPAAGTGTFPERWPSTP